MSISQRPLTSINCNPKANSGLYNYASIMEYSPFLFSRNGITPVLETIPAGMVLGSDLPQYTTGDLDGIKRLYGFATVGRYGGYQSHRVASGGGQRYL